jgi:hypothetical protein
MLIISIRGEQVAAAALPHTTAPREEFMTAAVKQVQQQLQAFRDAVSFGMKPGDTRLRSLQLVYTSPPTDVRLFLAGKHPSTQVDLLRFVISVEDRIEMGMTNECVLWHTYPCGHEQKSESVF